MGQKVHPYGFRLGTPSRGSRAGLSRKITTSCCSRTISFKTELKEKLKSAGVKLGRGRASGQQAAHHY